LNRGDVAPDAQSGIDAAKPGPKRCLEPDRCFERKSAAGQQMVARIAMSRIIQGLIRGADRAPRDGDLGQIGPARSSSIAL
jgi:hypothetical protein